VSGGHVVVTGQGAVSPLGIGAEPMLAGLWDNQVRIGPAPWTRPGDPFAWWAVVPGFEPRDWMDEKVVAGTDLFAQFALAAAVQAVTDAGLDRLDPVRTAVVHGTSVGGSRALMKAQYQYDTAGPAAVGGTEGGLPAASGQADGDFVPAMYIGQASDGMTTAERDPARASLPFDVHRSGIVTGEGSAALVLESSTGSGTCRCRSARSRATSDTPAPPRVR